MTEPASSGDGEEETPLTDEAFGDDRWSAEQQTTDFVYAGVVDAVPKALSASQLARDVLNVSAGTSVVVLREVPQATAWNVGDGAERPLDLGAERTVQAER